VASDGCFLVAGVSLHTGSGGQSWSPRNSTVAVREGAMHSALGCEGRKSAAPSLANHCRPRSQLAPRL
jgi:hypothetical protein